MKLFDPSLQYWIFRTRPLMVQIAILSLLLSMIFLPCAVVYGISTGNGIILAYLFFIPFSLFCLAIAHRLITFNFLRGGRTKAEILLAEWEKDKKYFRTIEQSDLISGEKIIISTTGCYIERPRLFQSNPHVQTITVTNQRIMYGGLVNLWHPKIQDVSEKPIMTFPGVNTKIRKISFGNNENGDYVEIVPDYGVLSSFRIYHAQARQIYELFSK